MRMILILTIGVVLAGCGPMPEQKTAVTIEFRPGSLSEEPGLTKMTAPGSDTPVYVSEDVVISNAHIKSARVEMQPNGPQIEIVFTESGTERFAQLTKQLIGKPLAIFIDGQLLSAPRVMAHIPDGRVVIVGKFSEEEAERIASAITGK